MSKYTTELRYIVESGTPVFDFNYPFYDESKRLEFQNRFIRHFYFHEIGFETVGMFKLYLENKFNELLPYYNEMFRTAQIKYNPLQTYDITEEYTRDTEGNTVANGTGEQRTSDTENTSREGLTKGTTTATGSTTNENSANITDESESTTNRTGENGSIVNSNADNTTKETANNNKAISDTPQGRVTIDTVNGDYVSSIEQDKVTSDKTDKHTGKEETSHTIKETDTTVNTGTNTRTETGKTENTENGSTETENTETAHRTNVLNATMENTQVGNSTGKETFKRQMYGDMGVRPTSHLLEEHLKFQRTINTIELQFFEECNDLFMQLW